jgi:hypothetical protein
MTETSEATAAPAAPEVAPPSAARVKRIEGLLIADPAIKEKLGKKEVSLKGRDGSTQRFAPETIAVTQAIIDAKKEPFTVLKKEVLAIARKVLKVDEAVSPASEPTTPPVEAAAAPAAKGGKKAAVDQTISIVSLLLSAINISEVGDTHSGAEARRKKLVEIKDEFVAAANIRIG